MPKRKARRGPARAEGSDIKLRCALRACKRKHIDVKNSCHQLTMDMVDLKKVRAMSKTCKRAKFCSAEHLSQAKLRAAKQARGGRESLTAQQVAHLFRVMLEDLSSAWTAVFLLLCIYLGERCGCTFYQHVTAGFLDSPLRSHSSDFRK